MIKFILVKGARYISGETMTNIIISIANTSKRTTKQAFVTKVAPIPITMMVATVTFSKPDKGVK